MMFLKHHSFFIKSLAIILIVVGAIAFNVIRRSQQPAKLAESVMGVQLINTSDYLNHKNFINANGIVESLQQAELSSQVSSPVTGIHAAIGDKVGVGQQLVSLQNSDMAAQYAQAQAGLKAQEARLEEMRKGLRSEALNLLEAKLDAAKRGQADTRATQQTMVDNAYKAMMNAGITAAPGVSNTQSLTATVSGSYSGSDKGQYRVSLQLSSQGARFSYQGLENGNGMVSTTPQPLGTRGLYIKFSTTEVANFVHYYWTVEIPNVESPAYLAASGAYESAIAAREAAVNAAQSGVEAVEKEFELQKAGASQEQLKIQEAAVDQARASVMATGSQLAKTVIRSPIAGTVAAINVKYGELVGPGQVVASVVNQDGLQAKGFVSEADLSNLEIGAEVLINDTVKAVVIRLSPSVNQQTKAVEVNAAVADAKNSGLLAGQNVSMKITGKKSSEGEVFILPLQAVKISSDGPYVYTVNEVSVLQERRVELGEVRGEFVEVVGGLQPDMRIVSTVYDLKTGQKVQAN